MKKHVEAKPSNHVKTKFDKMWTNNNTESTNNRLKVKIDWQPKATDQLVENLHDHVKVQMVDLRRSLYSSGKFIIIPKYVHVKESRLVRDAKSADQKLKAFQNFLKVGLSKEKRPVISSDGVYAVSKEP
ncbi:hypothetical protein DPMN_140783 [Dreissena polymorpha]|uniref:Uncharacterized protein n=1 Tax=Dreissena polymorpha TaxID=45954 RepID=A0A9D4GBJ8_DREPO|nr:hypothetical protein DPMN_140783 [Dreissena polymorpha]